MSIAALPKATVRAIGSSQALTDSCSVVKELVDNALDARASSVSVEISINTLDIIRVIDNGHGIAPIDRGLICHRNCTSKITSFEEISSIGGRCLGFRGEALASMAELSGGVTVITRIEGEPTATQMEMNKLGELVTQRQVSNTIGTSVLVKDFLNAIPVRREAALKGLNKTYAKVKTTLQAYALARPSVRFSFKVLKAKNEKVNWNYSPAPGISLYKAALQVLGQSAVKACEVQIWPPIGVESSAEPVAQDESLEQLVDIDPLQIEAVIPRRDCDLSAVNHIGQFVSVDSRPVSCARGTFKQVKSLFRKYLQNASSPGTSPKLVDPLLVMNVRCDLGTYDPNIEPAKDDVLFEDEAHILQSVETLFTQLYGKLKSKDDKSTKNLSDLGQSGFDLLLSRKSHPDVKRPESAQPNRSGDHIRLAKEGKTGGCSVATPVQTVNQVSGTLHVSSQSPYAEVDEDSVSPFQEIETSELSLRDDAENHSSRQSTPSGRPNMYADDDDLFFPPDDSPRPPDDDQDETLSRDAQVLNPWIVAKMNASIRPKVHSEPDGDVPYSFTNQLPTPARQRTDVCSIDIPNGPSATQPKPHRITLPTPNRSQPSIPGHIRQSESSPLQHLLSNSFGGSDHQSMQPQGCSPQGLPNLVIEPTSSRRKAPQAPRPNHQEGFISANVLPLELGIRPSSSPHPDLPLALDFEHRKSHAKSQHRAQQRLSQQRPTHPNPQYRQLNLSQDIHPTSPTSSPHANRYAKAVAALHGSQEEGASLTNDRAIESPRSEIILNPRDSRACLMRVQERQSGGADASRAAHKLKRVKTSMLPFETVPTGQETYALSCAIDTDPDAIAGLADVLQLYEEEESDYATAGFLGVDAETLGIWESRISEAVRNTHKRKRTDDESETTIAERDGVEIENDDFVLNLQAVLSETAGL